MNRARRGLMYGLDWWLGLPWPPPARAWWLRRFGATVGSQAVIHRCHFANLEVTGFRELTIGAGAHIGPECLIDLADAVSIGGQAALSPRVMILTHEEPASSKLRDRYPRKQGPVIIGNDAWIGAGATILHGVTIGAAAVVGAASLVNADVEANTTVAGVPAKPIPR